jgi:hypothetical protein
MNYVDSISPNDGGEPRDSPQSSGIARKRMDQRFEASRHRRSERTTNDIDMGNSGQLAFYHVDVRGL